MHIKFIKDILNEDSGIKVTIFEDQSTNKFLAEINGARTSLRFDSIEEVTQYANDITILKG